MRAGDVGGAAYAARRVQWRSSMLRHLASILLLLAACGRSPPSTAEPSPAATAERFTEPAAQPSAGPLPWLAGIILEPRMQRHAAELAALRAGVAATDFAQASRVAREILAEPRLARPSPDAATLNDELPAQFFALQDRLVAATRDVAAAADARDRAALDAAFADLQSTCDACHSLYRAAAP